MDETLQQELDELDFDETPAGEEDSEETPAESEETTEDSNDSEEEGTTVEEESEETEETKGEEKQGDETTSETHQEESTEDDPKPPADEIAALREEINRLNGLILSGQPQSQQKPKTEEPKPPEPSSDAAGESQTPSEETTITQQGMIDFIKDLDMDDVSANPEIFNKVLNNAVQHAIQRTFVTIPDLVVHQIKQQNALNTTIEQFYKENADLVSVKQTVGAVANSLSAEHSDWPVEKVLRESAKKTREILKMPAFSPSGDSDETVETNPDKAGGSSSKQKSSRRSSKTKLSDLQKELDEL